MNNYGIESEIYDKKCMKTKFNLDGNLARKNVRTS